MISNTSGQLYPGVGAHVTHRIGGCVDSRPVLDVLERRKITCPCRNLNSRSLPSRYTDYTTATGLESK